MPNNYHLIGDLLAKLRSVSARLEMQVPAYELPNRTLERPCPVGALIFINSSRNGRQLKMDTINSAEAAAGLYSNGLNQLAHTGYGVPVATCAARGVPSFFITGGTVEERSRAIQDLL